MNEQLLLTEDQENQLALEDALHDTSHMDCVELAIIRLREAAHRSEKYYHQPLMICYSGGKDSDTLVQLAIESGIDFEVVHSHTTADAPETVRYVRQRFREWEDRGIKCSIKYPYYKGERTSMWALIPQKKFPPTRVMRYCCEVLKETAGDGRAIATGVRWAESSRRLNGRGINEAIAKSKDKRIILMNDNDDKRLLNERCAMKHTTSCNPIIDWTDEDVFAYLKDRQIEGNPLYKCGFNRVGCVGCPVAGKHRWEEFRKYPKFRDMYIRSFQKMLDVNADKVYKNGWKNGHEVFLWWMEEDPNQMTLFDELEED